VNLNTSRKKEMSLSLPNSLVKKKEKLKGVRYSRIDWVIATHQTGKSVPCKIFDPAKDIEKNRNSKPMSCH
jgi:hypothetical protein